MIKFRSYLYNKLSSTVRYILQSAAGLFAIDSAKYHRVYDASTGRWDTFESQMHRPFDSEAGAKHIADVLRPLMITLVILEGLRFFIYLYDILKRWLYYKEAPTIESVTKLAYGALLLALMICTLVISVPVFLLVLSAVYFFKDVFLLGYYIYENSVLKRRLGHKSDVGIFDYTMNTLISTLLLSGAILFFIAPVAMSLTVIGIYIAAFSLGIIKLACDLFLYTNNNDDAKPYVDATFTKRISDCVLITEDRYASFRDHDDALDAVFSHDLFDKKEQETGITKKTFVEKLKTAWEEAKKPEHLTTTTKMETAFQCFRTSIEAIRKEAGENRSVWSSGETFFQRRPLQATFLPKLLEAVENRGTEKLCGEQYEKLCITELRTQQRL